MQSRPERSDLVYDEIELGGRTPRCKPIACMGLFQQLDFTIFRFDTWCEMQTTFKKKPARAGHTAHNLTELRSGESGILERLDLPDDDARRLMELGFVPGHTVTPSHSAPGGDPRVFRVDGSEVALRRETARKLILRQARAASA